MKSGVIVDPDVDPDVLMYETAAVLSVWTNTCLPNSSGRYYRKFVIGAIKNQEINKAI